MKGTSAAYNTSINTEARNKCDYIYLNKIFPVAWTALRRLSEQQKDLSIHTDPHLEIALHASFLHHERRRKTVGKDTSK